MQTHAWPIVTGCVIGIIVLAALTPWGKAQWGKLPNVYHPYVPALIGVLSAFGEALVAGKSWADAFVRDAMPAILGVLYTMRSATHTEPAKPDGFDPYKETADKVAENLGLKEPKD